jgi:hypothetical protein
MNAGGNDGLNQSGRGTVTDDNGSVLGVVPGIDGNRDGSKHCVRVSSINP